MILSSGVRSLIKVRCRHLSTHRNTEPLTTEAGAKSRKGNLLDFIVRKIANTNTGRHPHSVDVCGFKQPRRAKKKRILARAGQIAGRLDVLCDLSRFSLALGRDRSHDRFTTDLSLPPLLTPLADDKSDCRPSCQPICHGLPLTFLLPT